MTPAMHAATIVAVYFAAAVVVASVIGWLMNRAMR